MYLPTHFEESNLDVLHEAIETLSFGTLVTLGSHGLEANHLPFELKRDAGERGTLLCHVARANWVWQEVASSKVETLIIFQGPSAYISPNYYPTKQDTHRAVPTYNYLSVHAYGRVTVHEDEKWLRGAVGRLTRRFEAAQETPWTMSDAPLPFINELLGNIVGLEIEIARIEGKWKMNQNRPSVDQENVVQTLLQSSTAEERAFARAMQSHRASNSS